MASSLIKTSIYRLSLFIIIALLLIWHSLQYNFVTDDAYISFVFSENLAEHGQLVFNHGHPPVEGYTNFLWTFILGMLMYLGLPPSTMSLVLGTAFAIGTLWIVVRISEEVSEEASCWDYIAPLFLAISSGFACWSSGGLETQMFTFFVSLSLLIYTRGRSIPRLYRWLGVSLALAAMTRPEGLLIAGLLGIHRLVWKTVTRDLRPSKDELLLVGFFLFLWAPWFFWRVWYYGHFFPNTYYVKAAGAVSNGYESQMRSNGIYYFTQWLMQSKVLFVSPFILLGLMWHRRRSAGLVYGSCAALIFIVYSLYVVRVGGDFMGLHRFVMPLFVIAALGTVLGMRKIASRLSVPSFVAFAALMVCIVLFGVSQFRLTKMSVAWGNWKSDRGIDTPSYLAVYSHDRKLIGETMRSCFREDDFSIFGGVGAKPFHAKAKGIDVFGLVSEEIAHTIPRTRPRAGHNKWAPDQMLFDTYHPDFVFHCYSLHTNASRPSMNCGAGGTRFWTSRGYKQVTMKIEGLLERGEYYTFFVSQERAASFRKECQGVLP